MRFTRVSLEDPAELRRSILGEVDSLIPGLRTIATEVPLPGVGTIDAVATDPRGRLALIGFALTADSGAVGESVARWDWVVGNLTALRALVPTSGLDLGGQPRSLLVACRVIEEARRLAGRIVRPEIELFEAALLESGEKRGVLVERVAALPAPSAGESGLDSLLRALAPAEPRSLIRRILEEARPAGGDLGLEPMPIEGGVDLRLRGHAVASLVAVGGAVQLRRLGGEPILDVESDAGCRAAAAELRSLVDRGVPPPRTVTSATAIARAAEPALATALTADEIAEFERITVTAPPPSSALPGADAQPALATPESSQGRSTRLRFVEN